MSPGSPSALPVGLSTGIGCLPHCDPGDAVEFVLRHSPKLPWAPSLPARSRREGMVAQAACQVAGLDVADDGSITVDRAALDPDDPLESPTFDTDAHVGLRAFLTAVADHDGAVKVSVTGPVTLGAALVHAGLEPELAFRLAGNATRARARALVDHVAQRVPQAQVVVFVDEPVLGNLTNGGLPLAPGAAVDLVSGTLAAVETRATAGLHCCTPADWRLLLGAGPAVLSLPVDGGVERHAGALADFVEGGGWVAWGAVPVHGPLGATTHRLWRNLSDTWVELVDAGCDPVLLRARTIVTPVCGLAHHGVTQAEQVMDLTTALARRVHGQAIGSRLSVGA